MSPSKLIEAYTFNNIRLTLASWKPNPEFPACYEIGYRCGENFELIQFEMNSFKAFDIVKRLVEKGRTVIQIRKVLDRLER